MITALEFLALASLPFFLLLDLVHRARRYRTAPRWRLRAGLVSAFIFLFTGGVAAFWARLLGPHSLFHLDGLGTWAGAGVGIVVYELFHYAYHRAAHASDLLWRAGHQMHHSAESLDAWGANYLHPLDAFFFTTWSSLVFFPLLGLTAEAGVVGAFFLAFNAAFQHANLRTPRWLGWVIQRPEQHGIHHARGVHRYNYADLPLIDWVFGTFQNPAEWESACGFHRGASARLGEMLRGVDVSRANAPVEAAPARDLWTAAPAPTSRG